MYLCEEKRKLTMGKKVCFLGYDRNQTRIVEAVEAEGCEVIELKDEVDDFSEYDFVISFGYRHIIGSPLLKTLTRSAINLHMAYLPYNRGAHTNFWSWVEGTPAGVTIHEIDKGIDTGPICFQKQVIFDGAMKTFSATYTQLTKEIENLFIDNMQDLLGGTYRPRNQIGSGSYHNIRDLPGWLDNWDIDIGEAKRRYAGDK